MEDLVQFHGVSTYFGLEFRGLHKFGSAVSVDVSLMIMTSLGHIFPAPYLQLEPQILAWYLFVDPCIWLHQFVDEGSVMIFGLVTNLIRVQVPSPLFLGILAGVIFVNS